MYLEQDKALLKEWLEQEYLMKKKNTIRIAKECGVNPAAVSYYLKRFGIPTRSASEAQSLVKSNHVLLTKEALEFLYGELLGDGHLGRKSKVAANYAHTSQYREYIRWLSEKLISYGIEQSGQINMTFNNNFRYGSKSYIEIKDLHNQWYRKARADEKFSTGRQKRWIKILPEGLQLTPLICKQWYIGDGSLVFDSIGGAISLNCESFEIAETNYLVAQLNKLGFIAKRRKDNGIRCYSSSTKDFLSYIGPCPIKCYDYKWDTERG